MAYSPWAHADMNIGDEFFFDLNDPSELGRLRREVLMRWYYSYFR
jgi:hypothetical protein